MQLYLIFPPAAPIVKTDKYEPAKVSNIPKTIPPNNAPVMLPMPPITAAVKAFIPGKSQQKDQSE
jgi:hypothetical protein